MEQDMKSFCMYREFKGARLNATSCIYKDDDKNSQVKLEKEKAE